MTKINYKTQGYKYTQIFPPEKSISNITYDAFIQGLVHDLNLDRITPICIKIELHGEGMDI